MRTVTGTLLLPNSVPIGVGTLIFTAAETSNQVLEGSTATAGVDAAGAYTITLRNGAFRVYFEADGITRIYLGKIVVEDGNDIGLDTLLMQTRLFVPPDLIQYIAGEIETAGEGYQAIGDYLNVAYDIDDDPTTPTGLVLSLIEYNGIVSIKAVWDPSTNVSGNDIGYTFVYYIDEAEQTSMVVHDTTWTIPNVTVGETYAIKVKAASTSNTNRPSAGFAQGQITVVSANPTPIDAGTITADSGLDFIVLRWTNPTGNMYLKTHVYIGSTVGFTPDETNLIYSGVAPVFMHHVTDTNSYFFKFKTESSIGAFSTVTGPIGPHAAIKIDDTTIGQLMAEGAITAQHLADGAIVQEKLAANAVAASKLAVLDLTNLVENNNFTLFDIGTQTYPGWDFGATPPINFGADGYIELPANSEMSNNMQFSCSEGDKFYGTAKLSWVAPAGIANKGIQIIFLDVNDNELNSDFTIINVSTTHADDQVVEGFTVAPAETVKGFIRLKTEAVTASIKFKDVVCRKGAAVLIEDGEITADKINVGTLFALDIWVEGVLKTSQTANRGVIIGSAVGLQMYNNSGNLIVDFNPTSGDALFKGKLTAASITGNIEVVSGGYLRSPSKTYGAAAAGFFLGSSGGVYKFDIGNSTQYLRWDGSSLSIKGAITATSGSFTGAVTAQSGSITGNLQVSGGVYYGKTSYASTAAGFWLGGNSFHIGNNTDFMKWDGSALTLSKKSWLASGTWASSGRLFDSVWIGIQGEQGSFTITSYYTAFADIDTGYDAPTLSSDTNDIGLIGFITITSVSDDAQVSKTTAHAQIVRTGTGIGRVYLRVAMNHAKLAAGDIIGNVTGFSWILRGLI